MLYKILDLRLNNSRETNRTYLNLFITSALIFIGTIIIGIVFNKYFAGFSYKYMLTPSLNIINKILKIYDSTFINVLIIFFKNCLAIIASIYFARRTRGISIAVLLCMNGIIIGAILTMFYMCGMSLGMIMAGILPHGILEFVGVFLGASYGLKLLFIKEEEINEFSIDVKNKVIKILIPILFAAAFIEVVITPRFMSIIG